MIDTLTAGKKAAIVTNNLRCERNMQYSSRIEKYFLANGWTISEDFEVNLVVICACGFHDAMYEKIKTVLQKLKQINFPGNNIIIMGCLPKTHEKDLNEELKEEFEGVLINLHHESMLDELINAKVLFNEIPVSNIFKPHKKCHMDEAGDFFFIKISEGCLRECTFCVIYKAKGPLRSIPLAEIEQQYRTAIDQGMRRIFLIGEDTFAYGIDNGTTIIELVDYLLEIESEVELYLGSLHIQWIIKYSEELLSLCRRKFIKELRVGLQHVNDDMLKKMGRPGKFADAYKIISSIKEECPDLFLGADIITGFPGETEEMFNELMEFFKKDRCFNRVQHFSYSDVKGAPAYKFKDKIPLPVKMSRWQKLDKVLKERSSYNQTTTYTRMSEILFKISQMNDFLFCKNTFKDTIEHIPEPVEIRPANTNVLKKDLQSDFRF